MRSKLGVRLVILALFITVIGMHTFISQFQQNIPENQQALKELYAEEVLQERLLESEKIWQRWFKKKSLTSKLYINSSSVFNSGQIDYIQLWDWFVPIYSCPHLKERIGPLGAGGKWICGLSHLTKSKYPCVIYSYGVSSDTGFEREILQRTNCTVRIFDPILTKNLTAVFKLLNEFPGKAYFYPVGLSHENRDTNFTTLKTEMEKNGDVFIDILKIDAEGGEILALLKMIEDFPRGFPFAQLSVEVHLNVVEPDSRFDVLSKWWSELEFHGLRAFHTEPKLVAAIIGQISTILYNEVSFINVKVNNFLLHA